MQVRFLVLLSALLAVAVHGRGVNVALQSNGGVAQVPAEAAVGQVAALNDGALTWADFSSNSGYRATQLRNWTPCTSSVCPDSIRWALMSFNQSPIQSISVFSGLDHSSCSHMAVEIRVWATDMVVGTVSDWAAFRTDVTTSWLVPQNLAVVGGSVTDGNLIQVPQAAWLNPIVLQFDTIPAARSVAVQFVKSTCFTYNNNVHVVEIQVWTPPAPPDLTVGDFVAGNALGSASDTRFNDPMGVEVLQGDEVALVADYSNKRIVNVSLADGATNEFMSTGSALPHFLAVCDDGVGYFSSAGVKEFNTSDTSPSATLWVPTSNGYGLACLKNSTHNLLFVADHSVGIRAYDRSSNSPPANADDFVWQATVGELGVTNLVGISFSPDLQHLAFAYYHGHKVGTINLETNAKQLYGSGTRGTLDGTADAAQFFYPWDVAWAPDGSKILVNQYGGSFSGLRFIDFATGAVTSSAHGLMPTSLGRGVTVVRSTGEVVVTYNHGLKKMQVDGVTPAGCGNVPTVGNSDGGNNATAVGFVGDTVTYVCDDEFTTTVGTSQITTCQSDTLTWSTVSDCQSLADVMMRLLGNLTDVDVDSTLKAVVKAFGKSLCGDGTAVMLHKWCQLRAFQ